MFYNETIVNIGKKIREYVNESVVIDEASLNVLTYYILENIRTLVGDVEMGEKDVKCTIDKNMFSISTIYNRSIRFTINGPSFLINVDGNCFDEEDKIVDSFSIVKSANVITNACTFNGRESRREYTADVAKKEFVLSEEKLGKGEKEFIVKASPIGSKLGGNYLYEFERIYPKPNKDSGSFIKKFVDLLGSGSIMRVPVRDLADDFDVEVLFGVFAKLKEEMQPKNRTNNKGKIREKTN